MPLDVKSIEYCIDQAAELLKTAYSDLITKSHLGDYIFSKIDDKKVVENLRLIASMTRRLEQEIRESKERGGSN